MVIKYVSVHFLHHSVQPRQWMGGSKKQREGYMDQKKIDRINALARKSKAEGLTDAEKKEQALLRQEYIAIVRRNLRGQLNNIDVVNPDGSIENLGEKFGKTEEN